LKALLHLHGQGKYSVLTPEEATIMSGTLDFSQKTAQQIMTPINKVFMLNVLISVMSTFTKFHCLSFLISQIDQRLDSNLMREIVESGHSRLPVYEGCCNNIVAILLVKDLLLLNIKVFGLHLLLFARTTHSYSSFWC
jgi:metal transporter CNNM